MHAEWYELWDTKSGHQIGAFDTLLEAAENLVRMDQNGAPVNDMMLIPTMPKQGEEIQRN